METWNNRLLKALEESTFNKNSLAERVGVSAPTVSAWVGAAGINPAKTIAGDNLLKVCRALNIRPEWLMFREGPMRASSVDPELAAAIDLIATLPVKARELILVQIKGYADLTSQKVNEEAAEKGGTIGHPQQRHAAVDRGPNGGHQDWREAARL